MSEDNSYFVHEDDWAMIEFLPVSARPQIEAAMQNSGGLDEHPRIEAALPALPVAALETLFADSLMLADDLLSGRTTGMEPVPNGFALYHDLIGAVYGTERDGIAQTLYFDNRLCDCDHDLSGMIRGMVELSQQYDLMLADWWLDLAASLDGEEEARVYLEEA